MQYYADSTPDSINKIIFNVCDGVSSQCSASVVSYTFSIRKLKLPYIPSLASVDTITVTTSNGDVIAQKNIDASSFAPTLVSNPLGMSVGNSVTNSYSNFVFGFVCSEVVIDKQFAFSLPTGFSIVGSCSVNTNLTKIVIPFTCTVTSNNTANVSMDIDQNLMIPQTIAYTITFANVSTPSSMAPLQYSLSTTFNGTVNQKYSVVYSMQSALPMQVVYSKTNYTINQLFRLSLTIAPNVTAYDSWLVALPKNTVYV